MINVNMNFLLEGLRRKSFSKALGTGIGIVGFKDIEVLNDENGKPYINYQNLTTHLSITHTEEYALAFVVIEND